MFDLFQPFKSIFTVNYNLIENVVSVLHYRVSFSILLISSALVTSRMYIGEPINCMVTGIGTDIMNSYCWIMSTFTIPAINDDNSLHGIGPLKVGETARNHTYYQWVCIMLFIQAICFYIPHYIWKIMENGLMKKLLQDLHYVSLDEEKMKSKCNIICKYFKDNRNHHKLYLAKFLFCEILNLVNITAQIFVTNKFLNGVFYNYGMDVFQFFFDRSVLNIDYNPMDAVFPKVTKCKMDIFGASGSVQTFDALCLLPINIFNEKIYLSLWIWFVFLFCVTVVNALYKLIVLTVPHVRVYLLKWNLIKVSTKDIRTFMNQIDIGDWFVFYQLTQITDLKTGQYITEKLIEQMKEDEDCANNASNSDENAGENFEINVYDDGGELLALHQQHL